MRRAEYDKVIGVVMTTLGAQLEVVHVDEGRVPAPEDDAAALVAAEDATAERWGDCLRGTVGGSRLWVTHVGVGNRFKPRTGGAAARLRRPDAFHTADVLRVTMRHLHDGRVYFEPFAAGVLKAASAAFAERERQLVARSAGICAGVGRDGPSLAEDVPRHE